MGSPKRGPRVSVKQRAVHDLLHAAMLSRTIYGWTWNGPDAVTVYRCRAAHDVDLLDAGREPEWWPTSFAETAKVSRATWAVFQLETFGVPVPVSQSEARQMVTGEVPAEPVKARKSTRAELLAVIDALLATMGEDAPAEAKRVRAAA